MTYSVPGASPRGTASTQDRRRRSRRAARRRGPCRGCRSRRPRRPAGSSRRREPVGDLDAEAVVGRGRRCRCRRRGCAGRARAASRRAARPPRARRRTVAGLARTPRSRPGSSSTATASCTSPSMSCSMRFDDRGAPGERQVEHVAARARPQPHAAAAAAADAVDLDRSGARPLELLPVLSRRSPRAPASSRIAPCRRMSSSGVSASVRSRISRARGSDARISAFSSSVRLRMLRIEQLVDLAAVEEVARALGRDPRVVVEDDRRGQQRVARARVADEHRPGAHVLARARARRAQLPGGSVERDERAAVARAAPCASSRTSAAARPRARRRPTGVVFAIVTVRRQSAVSEPPAATSTAPSSACQERISAPARVPSPWRRSSRRSPRRRRSPRVARNADRPTAAGPRDLALDRLLPREVALAGDLELVDELEPVARGAPDAAPTTCRKRTRISTPRPARPRAGPRCASSTRRRDARRCARAGGRRRTSSASGS